jgi:hypothetical protein
MSMEGAAMSKGQIPLFDRHWQCLNPPRCVWGACLPGYERHSLVGADAHEQSYCLLGWFLLLLLLV